jgi:hypothetical protein
MASITLWLPKGPGVSVAKALTSPSGFKVTNGSPRLLSLRDQISAKKNLPEIDSGRLH